MERYEKNTVEITTYPVNVFTKQSNKQMFVNIKL